jgi:hypothetical protein
VRRVGHALHAAGDDDAGAARHQHVVSEHHGAHARAAHLRERHGARRLRQAGTERRLAGRCLPLAGHQAVAEQHLVDGVAGNAGALDGGPDGDRTELMRGKRGEVAQHAADGRAGGGTDDDGIGHGCLLQGRRAAKRLSAS